MKKEEYRKRLMDLGKRKDLIPFIHNYCDRWCERCPFTQRCGSFALTEGMENEENRDSRNKEFWDDLKVIFEVTAEMIKEQATEMGIDLDAIEDTDYKRDLTENDTTRLSKEYGHAVYQWLKENNKELSENAKNLFIANEKEALRLNDAIEVIEWYGFFISAKIHRAFLDFGIDTEDEDMNDGFINDQLGSAKIAIIAIDRSIAAWGFALNKLPQYEDDILRFLADLSRIKRELLAAFPKAMEFRRPGFDD